MKALGLVAVAIGALALPGTASTCIGDLDAAAAERIRAQVLPSAEELRFEEIPWIPAFGEGLARGQEERRPVLFWAMNGHPLGCT